MKPMGKMADDYDHIMNIDHDAPYRIPLSGAERFLFTGGRKKEKLDGVWNFSVDVYDTFLRKKFFEENTTDEQNRDKPVDYDFDGWEQVRVPSCWNMQQERYYYYEGTAVYTREFCYDPQQTDERIFLRVGAANYECRIWLNGKQLSRHQGGFTPFFTELTGFLQGKNRIIITVNNRRELEQVPSINYDWFNYGGIHRSVELYRVPPLFIQDLFVSLVPNSNFGQIRICLQLSEAIEGIPCWITIPELDIKRGATTGPDGQIDIQVAAKPELWSCEAPRLYTVNVIASTDSVSDQIGFREIRVQGKDIMLNGTSVFLKGVCCHEESSDTGRVMDDEERLKIITRAKEMGCNIIRLSHYPHSERMAALADREGILLWEEIPVYWALCFTNKQTLENASNQMQELVLRDRNRASVIIWSIGNENPDTDARLEFMSRLANICHEMDSTRPISAACLVNIDAMCVKDRLCSVVDIVAFNEYYGWYYRDYEGLTDILANTICEKPLIISETGAGSLPGHFGGNEELFTEEHQAKMYEMQFVNASNKIQGIFPWVLFDFRSPVRLHPKQGQHNRKGLIAFDKNYKKIAFYTVAEHYNKPR